MRTNPLIRYLESRGSLSQEEKRVLEHTAVELKDVRAHEEIVPAGACPSASSLILEGFACRYRSMPGQRRHITAILVPGDFVDLPSFLLKRVDHGAAALTRSRIALVPHDLLLTLTEKHLHLGRLLWQVTLIDAAGHRERLAIMRLPASVFTAHLLCELFVRLKVVGLTRGNSFSLPVTQAIVSQALGLSSVHVSRVIKELRTEGLVNWTGQTVTIPNWRRLSRYAHFNPAYLYLDKSPHTQDLQLDYG
jgi:CRP-like cAMP-binding protein